MSDLFQQTLARYNASRDVSDKPFRSPCYAPFTSMYFDVFGNVTACCHSKPYPLGNITRQSLDEIWRGPRARALRGAVRRDNFKLGCEFCQWQFDAGNADGNFIRRFDRRTVRDIDPPYPTQLEFSISNACNLECVMCNGEWSSSIRSRREKLPPLPKVYGDRFFDQLRDYLPHIEAALFYGGEPFVQKECFRIWDLMAEICPTAECWVTTNGTQFNPRIERLLEKLPFSFCISMDGVTKATVESVRVNANFERVRENVERFLAYARRRGTQVHLTYCMMRQNWQEFGDYLLYADERGCSVYVNTVDSPPDFSLYTLTAEELADVVHAMERQERTILPRLGPNRKVWLDELDRLRHQLLRPSNRKTFQVVSLTSFPTPEELETMDFSSRQNLYPAVRRQLERYFGSVPQERIAFDATGRCRAELSSELFLGLSVSELAGAHCTAVDRAIAHRYGERRSTREFWNGNAIALRRIELRSPKEVRTSFWLLAIPCLDGQGQFDGVVNYRIELQDEGRVKEIETEVLGLARARMVDFFLSRTEFPPPPRMEERARIAVESWAGLPPAEMDCDDRDRIVRVGGRLESLIGRSLLDFIGQPALAAQSALLAQFGPEIRLTQEQMRGWFIDRISAVKDQAGKQTYVRAVMIPRYGEAGEPVGVTIFAAATSSPRISAEPLAVIQVNPSDSAVANPAHDLR